MSMMKVAKSKYTPGFVLAAALLFTLSGPSTGRSSSGELTLASSTCDYVDALHHSQDGADCSFRQTINGLEVRSHVTVKRDTREVQDYLAPTPTKASPQTMFLVDLKLETDCNEDCQDHKRPSSDTFYLQMSELNNISKIISDHLKADGQELAQAEGDARKKAADAKRHQAQIEACEVREEVKDGTRIDTKLEGKSQLSCLANRMGQIDDEDKAADFYEKNIMGKVKALAASSEEADRKMAMSILEKVNQSGHGGNFVKESIADISMFAGAKSKAFDLQKQMIAMNGLPLNDPRRAQMGQVAQQAQLWNSYADTYFKGQNQKESYEPFSSQLGFDANSMLQQNNTAMQQMLDAQYANIIAQQRTGLAASNLPGQAPQLGQAGQVQNSGSLPPPPALPNTPAALAAKKQGLPQVTQLGH